MRPVWKREGQKLKVWLMRDEPYGVCAPVLLQVMPHVDGEKLPEKPTLVLDLCDDEYAKMMARDLLKETEG